MIPMSEPVKHPIMHVYDEMHVRENAKSYLDHFIQRGGRIEPEDYHDLDDETLTELAHRVLDIEIAQEIKQKGMLI
jgi:hypothetical protein